MRKSKILNIKNLLILGFVWFYLILFYTIFLAKGYYHADCTDTIMWAQATYDGKALINPDFAYAGILPLGGNIIMLPLVAIFGVSMEAQIIGMGIFCVLFAVAVILLCKIMNMSIHCTAVVTAVVFTMVSASEKLREIFWGHIIYYSLGAFFLLVGVALALKCIRLQDESKKLVTKKQIIWCILLFIWTVIASINGMQILAIYGLPVFAAMAAERFFDFETDLISVKNIKRCVLCLIFAIAMILGIVINNLVVKDVVAGYADAFSEFSNISEWGDNLLRFFPEFFSLLGVETGNDIFLYSPEGICNFLRIISGIILLLVPIIMVFMYKKFKDVSYRLMILTHHFMTLIILLGWVFGKLSSANWRLSPIIVTASILCVMFIKWGIREINYKRLLAIIVIPVGCMMIIVTGDILRSSQTIENEKLTSLSAYLKDEGLEYGYATFWQANIITMISDSDVKVRVIDIDEKGYSKRLYQTNENWYENVKEYDKYFVIFDEYEEYYIDNPNFEEPDEVLECAGYSIFVYDENIFRNED